MVLACSLLFSSRVFAEQHIDIVKYMGLEAGKWRISRSEDASNNLKTWDELTIINSDGKGRLLQSWYGLDDNKKWTVKEDGTLFTVDKRSLSLVGQIRNYNGASFKLTYYPYIIIPRFVSVNKTLFYQGILITPDKKNIPIVIALTVVETGITVTTPDWTFHDCIRVKIYESQGAGKASTRLAIWAPGRGEVQSVRSDIDSNDGGTLSVGGWTGEMTSFGDSRPPPVAP